METALPNLHPALVHFPIALVAVALLADALLAVRIAPRSFSVPTAALWGLAAAGGGAAYLSGERAHEGFAELAHAVHEAVEAHEEAALPALIAIIVVAALRIFSEWKAHRDGSDGRGSLRWAALVLALVAQGLVLRAADLGGVLVYRHGLAVEAVETLPPGAGAAESGGEAEAGEPHQH